MQDHNKQNVSAAMLVAAMAAGLFAAAVPQVAAAADADKVHCAGINTCKGKSACNSADHSCAGKNSCKGKGWIETTAKECAAKGGHVEAPRPMK